MGAVLLSKARALALFFLMSGVANGAETFGPFVFDPAQPTIATLDGPISHILPLDFRRMLSAHPEISTLVLNSGGGDVTGSLVVAHDVFSRRIATVVPKNAVCFSACSFIFLAGASREMYGTLGVHQIASETNDAYSTQVHLADVLDALAEFDAPRSLISDMLRTPPEEIFVYSAEEAVALGLSRNSEASASDAVPVSASIPVRVETTGSAIRDGDGISVVSMNGDYMPYSETRVIPKEIDLEGAMFRLGLIRSEFMALTGILREHLPAEHVPANTRFKIYYYPIEDDTGYVGHFLGRLSMFLPTPPDGGLEHAVSVVLKDNGLYAAGLNPETGAHRTPSLDGKTHRALLNQ